MTKRPSESAMADASAALGPWQVTLTTMSTVSGKDLRINVASLTEDVARAIDKAVAPYDKLLTAVLSQLAFDGEVHADTRAAIGALIAPARGAQGGTDE